MSERETQVREAKGLIREALKILENIDGAIEVTKKKKPKIPPKSSVESTDFTGIHARDVQFDLFNVTIETVYDEKAGVTNGKAWTKQSLMISDGREQRELIAWGDHMNHYEGLTKGQVLNVLCVAKCTVYQEKLQFTIGTNTDIDVIGEEHKP